MSRKSRRRTQVESKPTQATARLDWLDGLRGAAVLAMVAYHFGFDLNYFGWIHQNLNEDIAWRGARTLILGSFLFFAGASFALAQHRNASRRQHLQRIAKIAAAALLVSAGSWLVFPTTAIYFGTLHAIAVMGLLLLILPSWGWGLCGLGAAIIGFNLVYASAAFNQPALSWIGLRTVRPLTEDYVPLIPWFGICLIGCGAMRVALCSTRLADWRGPWCMPSWLAWTGRHSLPIYLVHQPIMLAMLFALRKLLHI